MKRKSVSSKTTEVPTTKHQMIDDAETGGYEAEPVMHEEGESEFHRAASEVMDVWLDSPLRLAWQYKGHKLLAFAAMTHALGKGELTGCETATDIAVMLFGSKKKKAAVTKAINYFRDNLHLPAMGGQRTDEARKAMHDSRNKQLVKGANDQR